MKNPNSRFNRLKEFLKGRWQNSDYPGGAARFQLPALGKDLVTFVALPAGAVFLWHSLSEAASSPRRSSARALPTEQARVDVSKSQVIEFRSDRRGLRGAVMLPKRAPGTLVRVRLLNVVEAYAAAPVHVQIVDAGLGPAFLGGTLIGDGTGDANFDRMNIVFKVARDSVHEALAFPIAARALSLNGTLGLEADKKEGAFTRAVYGAGSSGAGMALGNLDSMDLKSIVVKALTAGLTQEFGNGSEIERNRAAVLALKPGTEFFAELTDYFPAAGR
jgi:hypothetical protein